MNNPMMIYREQFIIDVCILVLFNAQFDDDDDDGERSECVFQL